MLFRPDNIQEPFYCETIEIDDRELVVPVLAIRFGEQAIQLHYWNSTVMRFGDRQFNHVEAVLDGSKRGIRFNDDMINLFIEHDFPRLYRPLVDESTLDWYTQLEIATLDEELDQIW